LTESEVAHASAEARYPAPLRYAQFAMNIESHFEPHPEGQARRESIRMLLHHILAARGAGIMDRHIKYALDTLIWKYTEADTKNNLRYRTVAAMRREGPIRHEHVYQKAQMITQLLSAQTEDVDAILASACGCLVTDQKHIRLKPFDWLYGWERYKSAEIAVYACSIGQWLLESATPTEKEELWLRQQGTEP
jgi:hypothetical protein